MSLQALADAIGIVQGEHTSAEGVKDICELLKTLITYCDNIIKDPENPKVQKINSRNPAFVRRIGRFFQSRDIMRALGFEYDGEFYGIPVMFSLEHLQTCRDYLSETLKNGMEQAGFAEERERGLGEYERELSRKRRAEQAELTDRNMQKLSNLNHKQKIYDSFHGPDDSRQRTGYVGIENQGATCYLNSLIQTLFHLKAFRKAVYQMPVGDAVGTKTLPIPLALQKLFYNMQTSTTWVKTDELTRSFGWQLQDVFTQHDVQELNRVLCDNLEAKMHNTPVAGAISGLYGGTMMSYIKCTRSDYASTHKEAFYDLQLNVNGCRNLYESFQQLTAEEFLTGNNQYNPGPEHGGLQDAYKGITLTQLPPVLQLQLKRFQYDPARNALTKINDEYQFPTELNLSEILPKLETEPFYNLFAIFVHSGSGLGGHYYVYIRPHPKSKPAEWCRFNDTRVDNTSADVAVTGSYGGESHSSANAYMLVYLADSATKELVEDDCPVGEELPAYFQREAARMEAERVERETRHLYRQVRVLCDGDLLEKGVDAILPAFSEASAASKFHGDTLLGNILETWRIERSVDASQCGLWRAQSSQEGYGGVLTRASDAALRLPIKDLDKESVLLYAAVATDPQQELLTFVVAYDPRNGTLNFVLSGGAREDAAVATCLPVDEVTDRYATFHLRRAMVPPTDLISRANRSIRRVPLDATFGSIGFVSGDTIVFQEILGHDESSPMPFADQYIEFFSSFVDLMVFPKVSPHDPETMVPITISLNAPYGEVAEMIAERINVPPSQLRLSGHQPSWDGPRPRPFAGAELESNLLMLLTGAGGSAPVMYYEIVEGLSVVSMDGSDGTVLSIFLRAPVRSDALGQNISLTVPSTTTIETILAEVASRSGSTTPLHLVEVYDCKIARVLAPEALVTSVNKYRRLEADFASEEDANLVANAVEAVRWVPVAQCHRHTKQSVYPTYVDVPFMLPVLESDTVQEIKQRIATRFGYTVEQAFRASKIAAVHNAKFAYFTDENPAGTTVLSRLKPDDYLAVEHAPVMASSGGGGESTGGRGNRARALQIHN